MSESITRHEYHEQCRGLAADLLEETTADNPREPDEDAEGYADRIREAIDELLWETIDGHEWVIYTKRSQEVLAVSDNDGYAISEWGSDWIVTDSTIDWSRLAFGAMYADVSGYLWPLFDEWADELAEEDE